MGRGILRRYNCATDKGFMERRFCWVGIIESERDIELCRRFRFYGER